MNKTTVMDKLMDSELSKVDVDNMTVKQIAAKIGVSVVEMTSLITGLEATPNMEKRQAIDDLTFQFNGREFLKLVTRMCESIKTLSPECPSTSVRGFAAGSLIPLYYSAYAPSNMELCMEEDFFEAGIQPAVFRKEIADYIKEVRPTKPADNGDIVWTLDRKKLVPRLRRFFGTWDKVPNNIKYIPAVLVALAAMHAFDSLAKPEDFEQQVLDAGISAEDLNFGMILAGGILEADGLM